MYIKNRAFSHERGARDLVEGASSEILERYITGFDDIAIEGVCSLMPKPT
jgi:hypothetical protein